MDMMCDIDALHLTFKITLITRMSLRIVIECTYLNTILITVIKITNIYKSNMCTLIFFAENSGMSEGSTQFHNDLY